MKQHFLLSCAHICFNHHINGARKTKEPNNARRIAAEACFIQSCVRFSTVLLRAIAERVGTSWPAPIQFRKPHKWFSRPDWARGSVVRSRIVSSAPRVRVSDAVLSLGTEAEITGFSCAWRPSETRHPVIDACYVEWWWSLSAWNQFQRCLVDCHAFGASKQKKKTPFVASFIGSGIFRHRQECRGNKKERERNHANEHRLLRASTRNNQVSV